MCLSFPNKSPLLCPFGTSLQSLFTGWRPDLSYSLSLVTCSITVFHQQTYFCPLSLVSKQHAGGQGTWWEYTDNNLVRRPKVLVSTILAYTVLLLCRVECWGQEGWIGICSALGSHPTGAPCPMPEWFHCTFLFVEPSNGTQDWRRIERRCEIPGKHEGFCPLSGGKGLGRLWVLVSGHHIGLFLFSSSPPIIMKMG